VLAKGKRFFLRRHELGAAAQVWQYIDVCFFRKGSGRVAGLRFFPRPGKGPGPSIARLFRTFVYKDASFISNLFPEPGRSEAEIEASAHFRCGRSTMGPRDEASKTGPRHQESRDAKYLGRDDYFLIPLPAFGFHARTIIDPILGGGNSTKAVSRDPQPFTTRRRSTLPSRRRGLPNRRIEQRPAVSSAGSLLIPVS